MGIGLIVALVVVAVIVMWLVGIYNKLVGLRNRFKNAFAQIDVQLKRRYDLIPNLVETAKGYLKHERETLEAVIAARNQAMTAAQKAAANPADAAAMQGLIGAETALAGAMGRLFALAEAYPDLKANQTMLQLMEELTSTENKVAFARQALQRRGHGLQHDARDVPERPGRQPVRLRRAPSCSRSPRAAEREAPKVSFT